MVSIDAPTTGLPISTYSLPVTVAKANDSVNEVAANINLPVGILRGSIIVSARMRKAPLRQLFNGWTQIVQMVGTGRKNRRESVRE